MNLYQRESDARPRINAIELFETAEERHSNAAEALRYFVPAAVPNRNLEVPRQKKKRGKPKDKFTNRRATYWKKHMQSDLTAEAKARPIRGGPYTEADLTALVKYCESDVVLLAKLLPAMLPQLDLPRALLRGRYMAAARIFQIAAALQERALMPPLLMALTGYD